MRAAVYYGPTRLEVTEVPAPDPGVGQVKVKVGFNGICGTDLHEFYSGPIFVPTEPHPLMGRQLPLTLGHEFSGVITDVGDEVIGYAEGDRVAIEPIYSCGRCGPCEAELYNLCQHIGMHGLTADGGMAEYAVVPTHMLHRLPENVSLELGALVEPMSVAYPRGRVGRRLRMGRGGGIRCGSDRHRDLVCLARQGRPGHRCGRTVHYPPEGD
jgi:(R,R)-butanediol dehydrogenase/meso-butanediol dehydrogenase/diacetyl reductase